MKRIVLIGSGNVAASLAPALAGISEGYSLAQLFGRNPERTRQIADQVGCAWTTSPEELAPADIYLMSISDRAIGKLSNCLDFPAEAIVAHTAGSVPFDELSPKIRHRGIFYPLQTFTAGRHIDLRQVPLFICGTDSITTGPLTDLAHRLSDQVYPSNPEQLRQIHLAAVFACNFSNHLYAIAQELLARKEIPAHVLRPLIAETTAKALSADRAADVQTGPARRGDFSTQERHLNMLADRPDLQQIYQNISHNIWETSKKT